MFIATYQLLSIVPHNINLEIHYMILLLTTQVKNLELYKVFQCLVAKDKTKKLEVFFST